MQAIAVLTRGYNNIHQYNMLIQRNLYISKYLNNIKQTDILIFHEGNINEVHQNYIKSKTPNLNIIFICILEFAFDKSKRNIKFYEPTKMFTLNYRHMCSFWFVDFWKYVEKYEKIIRIDEDCNIFFNLDIVFYLLNYKAAIFGNWVMDEDKVTYGLNNFMMMFLKNNNLVQRMKQRKPSGPYTNVIGFNMNILRQNKLLNDYVNEIKASNNIYIYRWGDLSLWGEALSYFFPPNFYLKLNKIKYYHGSHNQHVENGSNVNKIKALFNFK